MALLRSSIGQDPGPIIRGERVILRAAQMHDYVAWAELRALSRDHLKNWEPLWARDELTRNAFRRRVRHYVKEAREDLGYAYLIFAVDPAGVSAQAPARGKRGWTPTPQLPNHTLVGGLTLSNVRRGVTQAATLGYWTGEPYTRRGLMKDALTAVIPFAFDVLRLHRIEAAVMPANAASIALLDGIGFQREGLARRYLKISGSWQDHALFALIADDAVGGEVSQ